MVDPTNFRYASPVKPCFLRPAIDSRRVDLPTPDCPITAVNCPALTSPESPVKITFLDVDRLTP